MMRRPMVPRGRSQAGVGIFAWRRFLGTRRLLPRTKPEKHFGIQRRPNVGHGVTLPERSHPHTDMFRRVREQRQMARPFDRLRQRPLVLGAGPCLAPRIYAPAV